jgi:hypothetical protein
MSHRRVMLMLMCIALGAVVSFLMACACLTWGRPHPLHQEMQQIEADRASFLWRRYAAAGWPQRPDDAYQLNTKSVSEFVIAKYDQSTPIPNTYAITVMDAGWPLRAFRGAMRNTHTSPLVCLDLTITDWRWPVLIPRSPLWSGLLINTIFYAAISWLLIRGPAETRRRWRELRGRCGNCAYPRGESIICTECGADLSRTWRRYVAHSPDRARGPKGTGTLRP